MRPLLCLIPLVLLLPACEAITGKELARLPIESLSTPEDLVMGEATLNLKKDDVIALWSHLDLAYDGVAALRMRVRVVKDDADLQLFELDPMEKNVTIGETKTELNGHTEWSFTGKNGEYTVPEDGAYTFKAILTAEENPSLVLKKAELVLKQ
ncbi:MAG: hypothetical protein IPK70_13185 [Flavobacteriales bacterium]|jgi:hypothetical protein|nr:hypothetical protein [Flavobacteriales bacterium]